MPVQPGDFSVRCGLLQEFSARPRRGVRHHAARRGIGRRV